MLLQAHEQTPQAVGPWAPVVTLVHTAPRKHRNLAPHHQWDLSLSVSNSLLPALGHLAVEARSSPASRLLLRSQIHLTPFSTINHSSSWQLHPKQGRDLSFCYGTWLSCSKHMVLSSFSLLQGVYQVQLAQCKPLTLAFIRRKQKKRICQIQESHIPQKLISSKCFPQIFLPDITNNTIFFDPKPPEISTWLGLPQSPLAHT